MEKIIIRNGHKIVCHQTHYGSYLVVDYVHCYGGSIVDVAASYDSKGYPIHKEFSRFSNALHFMRMCVKASAEQW